MAQRGPSPPACTPCAHLVPTGLLAALTAANATSASPCHSPALPAAFPAITEPRPNFHRVLLWGQEKIGKSYLVDGRLVGPDVADSGAPQVRRLACAS